MNHISEDLQKILRSHYQELDSIGLSGEDSTIILFLLTLLKEKVDFRISHKISSLQNTPLLFKDDNPQLELNVEYPKIELKNVSESHQYLLTINKIFSSRLRILTTKFYDKVVQILEEFVEEDLQTHFSEIFEAFLNFIVERQGKKSGEFILPTEIGSFLMQLADQEDNASIFNPFSGFSTFGIHLKGNQQYHAQEINSLVWAVSMLRLNAFGRISNSRLQNADTFSNWPVSERYDLIISNPPFRLKLDKNQQNEFPGIKTVEGFIIEEGLQLLAEQGKLITLVPMSFLSSGADDKKVREQLIDADILEAVISMPSGLLMQTNIPFAILLINKKKINNGVVAFINGDKFVIKNGKKLLLDSEPLLTEFQKTLEVDLDKNQVQEPIAEYQKGSQGNKFISIEEIIDLDYNLNVDRYQLDKISGIALRELVKTFPIKSNRDIQKQLLKNDPVLGKIAILATKGNILKGKSILTRDLKNDPFDYVVDLNNIDADELKHGSVIRGNPLLVSLVGKNLKPSYVDSKKDFFYINQNIFPFSINDEILDRDWFINQLHSDHVKRQAEILRLGAAQLFLKKDDFLSIKINVPSLKEQKTEVAKLKGVLKQIDTLESNIIQQDSYLRHTLAGPVSDLEEAINNIDQIIQNIAQKSLSGIGKLKVSENHLYTLEDYLSDSKNYISTILETVKSKLNASKEIELKPLTPLNLFTLIESYCSRKNNINLDYQLLFDFDEGYFGTIDDPKDMALIKGNESLLISLLDNMIDNAVKHGFKDNSDNRIEFYLTAYMETPGEEEILLLISNTGIPLSNDFKLEKFIRKGYSQGDHQGEGFGGWLINEIVRKHNGQLDVIDETGREGLVNTELVTTFEISFPKIEIDEEI